MAQIVRNVVEWLQFWFYTKNEVYAKSETYDKNTIDSALNNKLNSNLSTGNKMLITDSSGNVDLEDKPNLSVKSDKSGGVQQITDANAHTNLGTSANATQGTINTAIDNVIITMDDVYPVGSIYMSVNSTSPQSLFGGTWIQLTDTFLYASNTADTNSTTATGGEATHTLTENEMPSHTHTQNAHAHKPLDQTSFVETDASALSTGSTKRQATSNTSGNFYWQSNQSSQPTIARHTVTGNVTATNQNTGGGQAHNNMPPYMRVFMWKRTA